MQLASEMVPSGMVFDSVLCYKLNTVLFIVIFFSR